MPLVRVVYAHDLPHQWTYWPSWPVWRWGQMYPEDIGYRDIEEVQHREGYDDERWRKDHDTA